MIRRSTWIFVIILAALVGLTWYLNRPNTQAETDVTPTPRQTVYLFSSDEGVPNDIQIKSQSGDEVEIRRAANGNWVIETPELGDADAGKAEAAATQITTLQVLNTLEVDPQSVELQPPDYTLSILFSNGKRHQIQIGMSTPTNSGYYVQREDGTIAIVDQSGIESLLNLLTNPPYAPTATPSPEATPAAPAATSTLPAINPTATP